MSPALVRLLNALSQHGSRTAGKDRWASRCPAHDDRKPSLSITEGPDGRALLHCHAGCVTADVVGALGLSMADLMPVTAERRPGSNGTPDRGSEARRGNGGRGRIAATYDYRGERRELLYQVVRYEPKDFRQRRPAGDGWKWSIGDVRRVLYRLPELLTSKPENLVFIVEGEKDADNLARVGFVATTNAGGAGKWRPEYSEALRGRHVVIPPDNDEPGRKHAEQVAETLKGIAASVKVVELPGLPAKGDVSDWLARGGTVAALLALVERAPLQDQREPGADDGDETPPIDLAALAASEGAPGDYVPPPEDFGTLDLVASAEPGAPAERSPAAPHVATARAHLVSLADVESRDVPWLWPQRLPAGMIAVFDGAPGTGKSSVVCDLVARMTTGRPWPGAVGNNEPRTVVLIGGEDSPEHTIRPRLNVAGADPSRVRLLTDVGGRLPCLPGDAAAIEQAIAETRAGLLVFDPVSAYIGGADLHKDNSVRAALLPLAAIAQRQGVTVLLIRHLRKSGGTDAIYRGLGSVAITALARAGLMLLRDPDDPEARVLTWPKLSVGPLPQSLRWRFDKAPAGKPPRIVWDTAPCAMSANDILAREDEKHRGGAREEATATASAEAWLMRRFEEAGAIPTSEIRERAAVEGIAWRTVETAKGRLGIRARRESNGQTGAGRWLWVASDRKTARHTSPAALHEEGDGPTGNSMAGAGLRDVGKAADPQGGLADLAALQGVDSEDILRAAEGGSP
jgi:putative DNA primase/helicase